MWQQKPEAASPVCGAMPANEPPPFAGQIATPPDFATFACYKLVCDRNLSRTLSTYAGILAVNWP